MLVVILNIAGTKVRCRKDGARMIVGCGNEKLRGPGAEVGVAWGRVEEGGHLHRPSVYPMVGVGARVIFPMESVG